MSYGEFSWIPSGGDATFMTHGLNCLPFNECVPRVALPFSNIISINIILLK